MRVILFQFEAAAHIARIAMMMTTTAASNSSADLGKSAVERASQQNKWLFLAYMFCIVSAALLTYLLWKSGNNVQDAIVADANARIEEAKSTAATAIERAQKLENENLVLRGELDTHSGQVAGLQKEASDAKTAQQQVQVQLAKQQERAASAEKSLLEVLEKLRYRSVSDKQRKAFLATTSGMTKGAVEVTALSGDPESIAFAESLRSLLIEAGWLSDSVKNTLVLGDNAIGLTLAFDSVEQLELDPRQPRSVVIPEESPIFHGLAIKRGFEAAKIPLARSMSASKAPTNAVVLIVGAKP
jgi:hypothetical protein